LQRMLVATAPSIRLPTQKENSPNFPGPSQVILRIKGLNVRKAYCFKTGPDFQLRIAPLQKCHIRAVPYDTL